KLRCHHLSNCEMKWGDYGKVDLARYDFVFAYLSPVPMPMLFEKARREMRKGSFLISNSFSVPGMDPDEIVEAGDRRLYFWRM
ncbi:MAG TPA: class I SAM-dependent methyltransferase, partial [Burkholderiales bacterium]|nr:class I SAM-dependent methyltransferase [Burkholderiales bacterium]